MTSPIPYATPLDAKTLPFIDRRTSLLVAGVFLLILGAISGCIGITTPLGMYLALAMGPGPGTTRPAPQFGFDWRTMASAALTYAALAVLWIWIGVGAVRLRRWVRPLVLIVGWTWLATGAFGVLYWLVAAPGAADMMAASTAAGPPAPPGARPPVAVFRAIAWSTGVFMVLLMVVMPGVLVWLFARKGVRDTVEYFDPQVRWTEQCPTAVLAVSVWLVMAAGGCLMYAFYGVLPLFGAIVTGPLAAVGLVVVAAAFAVLAWQVYRLRPAAWWGAMFAILFWASNTVWTFSRTGWGEFYRRAGYSPQQTDMMLRYSAGSENAMLWAMGFWTIVWVVYLMYVRKFFRPAGAAQLPSVAPTPPEGTIPS